MQHIKAYIKKIAPNWLLQLKQRNHFKGMNTQQVFTKIYTENLWGTDNTKTDFYSGPGSHDHTLVSGYVTAVKIFLETLENPVNVVDLGCGDFAVGSQIYPFCNQYTACDIVEPLIKRNQEKFKDTGVNFQVVNLVTDPLPKGDIVCIREVLQHLSNEEIQQAIPKLQAQYRYLILSECLPQNKDFVPNLNITTGSGIRLHMGKTGSGVVLTAAPFNLAAKHSQVLFEYPLDNGMLFQTHLYQLGS